jgi:hypothetical protein
MMAFQPPRGSFFSPVMPILATCPTTGLTWPTTLPNSCGNIAQMIRCGSNTGPVFNRKNNTNSFYLPNHTQRALQPLGHQSDPNDHHPRIFANQTTEPRRWSEVVFDSPSHPQPVAESDLLKNDPPSNKSQPLKFVNPKILYFRRSFNLLIKLFTNSQIETQDLELREMERLLTVYVCRRKFPSLLIPIAKDHQLGHEHFCTVVQRCRVELSNKRIEENIKFIFKLTMKHLKDLFKTRNMQYEAFESSDDFYLYYFRKVAERAAMPLEAFRDPLNNKRPKSKKMPRTLNNDYMHLLFQSSSFTRDFKAYLSSDKLIADYVKTVPNKFEKILLRWERYWEDRIDQRIFREKLKEYFFRNKQCKLPWTVNEIISAVSYYLNMIRTMDSGRD